MSTKTITTPVRSGFDVIDGLHTDPAWAAYGPVARAAILAIDPDLHLDRDLELVLTVEPGPVLTVRVAVAPSSVAQ